MTASGASEYRRGLHVLAVLTAAAVFPLIVVGAGVTSKDAGMAFPNGFTSNGYFLRNPPGWWDRDDTRWEHGHRLLGRTVGLLAIALAVGCWRRGGAVRAMGLAMLSAIVVQGLLGAFRVNEVSTGLAMFHGILGQLCFCLACATALVVGRSWRLESGRLEVEQAGFLQRLCVAGTVVCFLQLVSGAALRHFGGGVSLLAHILGVIGVTCVVGWVAMWVMGQGTGRHLLVRLGRVMAVLMVVQLMLGGFAFTVTVMGGSWSRFVLWAVPSAHVAVGALLLVSTVLTTMCAYRMVRPAPEESRRGVAASATT